MVLRREHDRLRLASAMATLALLTVVSAAGAQQQPPSPETAAPVVVNGETLFSVQERILAFSPEERARAISERIEALSSGPPIQVQVMDYESMTEIAAGDVVIMAVTEGDARMAGMTRQSLAQQRAQLIQTAIDTLRSEYSSRSILLGIVYSVILTLALLLVLRLLLVAHRHFTALLKSSRRMPSLRIQQFVLFGAAQITAAMLVTARVLRAAAVLAAIYIYVSLVFGFFPWTRGYGVVLLGYVLAPLQATVTAVASHLPDFFFMVVVVVLAVYVSKLVKLIFDGIGRGAIRIQGFYPDWAAPTYKIVRFVIIALTLAIVLPSIPGYQSPAFQGVSIFVGILLSLSSTAAVSNIVAGLALTYTRGFQVGDRVKIGETVGDVLEKTLLVTRVRTIKNVDISIPNTLVLSNHMINFSSSAERDGLILNTSVTIGYDVPWRQVHQLLIDAALDTEGISDTPPPFVFQTALNDFFVTYEINAYTKTPGLMARTYSKLHEKIQDHFSRAGVEIMSPHYTSFRDGNDVAIPSTENWAATKHASSGKEVPSK